jgi:DNA-binding NarL/FixJ family response regulator
MHTDGHRLLLVEDEPDHVALVRAALRRTGSWQVVADCADPDEALQLAAEHAPDAALVDLTLGRQSGRGLIVDLLVDHPTTMIVALSAEPADRARRELLELGAFGYIEKSRDVFVNSNLAAELDRLHHLFRQAVEDGFETIIPLPAAVDLSH